MSGLIFVGGIHGVGKGTICTEICSQTDLIHITASEVLKWNEISDQVTNIFNDKRLYTFKMELLYNLRKPIFPLAYA